MSGIFSPEGPRRIKERNCKNPADGLVTRLLRSCMCKNGCFLPRNSWLREPSCITVGECNEENRLQKVGREALARPFNLEVFSTQGTGIPATTSPGAWSVYLYIVSRAGTQTMPAHTKCLGLEPLVRTPDRSRRVEGHTLGARPATGRGALGV